VNRTDYQLIDISEDGFVSWCFCSDFSLFIIIVNGEISLASVMNSEHGFATKIIVGESAYWKWEH